MVNTTDCGSVNVGSTPSLTPTWRVIQQGSCHRLLSEWYPKKVFVSITMLSALYAYVVQWSERTPDTREVGSSSLPISTISSFSSEAEQNPVKVEVEIS